MVDLDFFATNNKEGIVPNQKYNQRHDSLSFLFVVVINHDLNQYGDEQCNWDCYILQVTGHHQGGPGRELKQRPQRKGNCLRAFLLAQPAFLSNPGSPAQEMALTTVAWALHINDH